MVANTAVGRTHGRVWACSSPLRRWRLRSLHGRYTSRLCTQLSNAGMDCDRRNLGEAATGDVVALSATLALPSGNFDAILVVLIMNSYLWLVFSSGNPHDGLTLFENRQATIVKVQEVVPGYLSSLGCPAFRYFMYHCADLKRYISRM